MMFIFRANDERVHHYQRRRTSITGLRLHSVKNIETERLVVVAWRGLCVPCMGTL
jgi:hypothetical protein